MTTQPASQPDVYGFPALDPDALPNDPQIDRTLNRYIYALGGYLKKKEDRSRVPGAAVMVRKGNEIVHMNCYGYANLETQQKITLATIFDLGSLSKQFTAAAVLNLCSKGLELSDPISKYFKKFANHPDAITVEQLMHHTSALPEYFAMQASSKTMQDELYEKAMRQPDDWYPEMLSRKKKEVTNKDVLRWIASQQISDEKPGTEMEYSNSGYVVLAELVERVSTQRLGAYLKEQIFKLLGMNDTFVFDETCVFPRDAPEVLNHARCYNRLKAEGFVPVGYTPLNFIYGDGNVHSTIMDLARWEMNLQNIDYGAMYTKKKSDKSAFNEIRNLLWAPVHLKNRKRVDYGAGWNLLSNKYEDEVEEEGKMVTKDFESRAEYHRGVWLGWRSYIARASRWLVPEEGKDIDPRTWESLGIVVLSNNSQFNTCRIAQHISHLYWGERKKNNIMNRFNC
ncbi:MAG: serine hydrolase domain-containing protein [Acidobacteriota bacterium]